MRKLAILPVLAFAAMGCSALERVEDEDLFRVVNVASEKAVRYGLKYAMDKDPQKGAAILEEAQRASTVIKQNIIPLLSGASSEEVVRSAIDTTLVELRSKLTPLTESIVRLATDIAATHIKLPPNPADKLDERTRGLLLAFFSGISAGVDGVMAPEAPPPAGSLSIPDNP